MHGIIVITGRGWAGDRVGGGDDGDNGGVGGDDARGGDVGGRGGSRTAPTANTPTINVPTAPNAPARRPYR
jgi:hypothetical protein